MDDNHLNITSAQYQKLGDVVLGIKTIIDDKEYFVPIIASNRHYMEIQRQVKEGTLTIKDAD